MPTILIIDDDPITRLLLETIFKRHHYQVAIAHNGEMGLAIAREISPAVILCDWMLPEISGIEVCQQVKQDPQLNLSFFILVTGRDQLEDRVQGLDAGADDYITKPIEPYELMARVRSGLRLYQSNQTLHLQAKELAELNQALATQKQILEVELGKASEYIRSILPAPLTTPLEIDSCFLPSMQLGGDCFDYFWLDPDFLAIYLLDVSGHGVGSSLLAISVLNLLRSQALDQVNFYQPSSVLSRLNEDFQMEKQDFKYFTIWYGVYNIPEQQVVYAGAGHPPALIFSPENGSEAMTELPSQNMPIGFDSTLRFTQSFYKLKPGSELYLLSDGIFEAHCASGETLGWDRFKTLLQDFHRQADTDIAALPDYIQQTGNIAAYQDDVSLLRLRLHQHPEG